LLAKARKITVRGEEWQWQTKGTKPEHRCGDPMCSGYFAQAVRVTLCRVVDNHTMQVDVNIMDGVGVTPAWVAKVIERHWVPVKPPKKKKKR
jgi:hypothetical protein